MKKTTRFLFSVAGLLLIITGLVCVGAVVASFSTSNIVKLTEFGDNYIQVSLSQTALSIDQAQSATFSVTVQSLDSSYSIESISTIWSIDGAPAGTGSSSLTFVGTDVGVGTHTISCAVTVSYIADGGVSYNQGYYPSGTITVQSAQAPTPTPIGQAPTPTPIGQTPTPTPYGQTPTPTQTNYPTPPSTTQGLSNTIDRTLLAIMGGLFIGVGGFLIWAKQYF